MSWCHMPFLMLNSSPLVTNWPGFCVAFWLSSNQVTRLPGSTKTNQALGCSRNSGRKRLHSWAPTSTMTSPGVSGYHGTWNLHGAWRCVRHVSLRVTKVQRVIFWSVKGEDSGWDVCWCIVMYDDSWWFVMISHYMCCSMVINDEIVRDDLWWCVMIHVELWWFCCDIM